MTDVVTIVGGGATLRAWTQGEITRDIESLASTASLMVTLVPGHVPAVRRQDIVSVHVGSSLVMTGRVLMADPGYNLQDCYVRVAVRSLPGDLIKSTAMVRGGSWARVPLDRLVRDLITPFGLTLDVQSDIGAPIDAFKLQESETVVSALSRAAKLRGVLVTSDPSGRVVLRKAGSKTFRGAIRRGSNVLEASPIGSDEDRHSTYIVSSSGGGTGGLIQSLEDFERHRPTIAGTRCTAQDADIRRYLPLVINADGNSSKAELQRLVEHTMRVRRGQAYGYEYTVPGWTYDGDVWPVGDLVPIYDDVVGLAGTPWLICSVRSTVDLAGGPISKIVVRPKEAYDSVPLKSKPVRKSFRGAGPSDQADGGAK